MRVRVFVEPQRGATYDDLLGVARRAEDCGFDGFFRADHYQAIGSSDGLPGSTDALLTLAGLARETSRIRLGTLVASATFRLPGPLAVNVAQLDQMSGGRFELGLGTGWYAPEHASYGIGFPPVSERFDRLEEQLQIVTGLWTAPLGSRFSFAGRYYQLVDSPALPKPVQAGGPPVIVGGRGPKRTPEIAARYAAEFNLPMKSVAATAEQFSRVREACARVGRTRPLRLSAAISVACGRSAAEVARRSAALHQQTDLPPEDDLCGSPAQLVERIASFGEIGATTVYLRIIDLADLDHLDLIAAEVLPHVDHHPPRVDVGLSTPK